MTRRRFIAACGTILVGATATVHGPVGAVFAEDVWTVQVCVDSVGTVLLKSLQPLLVGDFVRSDERGYICKALNVDDRSIGVVVAMRELDA